MALLNTPAIFSERWPKPVPLLDEPKPDPGALAVGVRARFGRATFAAGPRAALNRLMQREKDGVFALFNGGPLTANADN